MTERRSGQEPRGLYGALLGGLMASFVALSVLWGFNEFSEPNAAVAVLVAALTGLTCAVAFMVAGTFVAERHAWLRSALLFASGFTALWSVGASLAAEPRWATLSALGVGIALGVVLGRRHYARQPQPPAIDRNEAAWTL